MGIAIPGLGSGLDVNSMITSLMQAESQPQTQLKTQQSANSVKAGAWTSLATIITSLQSAGEALNTPALVPAVTGTSSSPSLASVSIAASATPGSVTFRVKNLAGAQQLASSGLSATDTVDASTTVMSSWTGGTGSPAPTVTATNTLASTHHTVQVVGSGASAVALVDGTSQKWDANSNQVLTLADGTVVDFGGAATAGTFSVGIAKTSSGATVADLAAALTTAGGPARAALVDTGDGTTTPDTLVLTSNATGKVGALTVTSTYAPLNYHGEGPGTASGSHMTELAAATDATLVVGSGSGAMTISKPTNTVTDLLGGATISLVAADPDTDVTVSIARDTSGTVKKVQDLVTDLNGALSWIGTNTAWDSTKNTGGPMTGESGVRDVADGLVRAMQTMPATGSLHALADLGITLQRDGTYAVDSTKLQSALTADPDGFATYVSSLAGAIATSATAATGTDGAITLGKAATATTDKQLQDEIDSWTSRLSDIQTRYEKMFSDLDVAMNQLKSQQSQLTSALASLPTNSG